MSKADGGEKPTPRNSMQFSSAERKILGEELLAHIENALADPDIIELDEMGKAEKLPLSTILFLLSSDPKSLAHFRTLKQAGRHIGQRCFLAIFAQARDAASLGSLCDDVLLGILKKATAYCRTQQPDDADYASLKAQLGIEFERSIVEGFLFNWSRPFDLGILPPLFMESLRKTASAAEPKKSAPLPGLPGSQPSQVPPKPVRGPKGPTPAHMRQKLIDAEWVSMHADFKTRIAKYHSSDIILQNKSWALVALDRLSLKAEDILALADAYIESHPEVASYSPDDVRELVTEARTLFQGKGATLQLREHPPLYLHHVPIAMDADSGDSLQYSEAREDLLGNEFIVVSARSQPPVVSPRHRGDDSYTHFGGMKSDELCLQFSTTLFDAIIAGTTTSVAALVTKPIPSQQLNHQRDRLCYLAATLLVRSLLQGTERVRSYEKDLREAFKTNPEQYPDEPATQEEGEAGEVSTPLTAPPEDSAGAVETVVALQERIKKVHASFPSLKSKRAHRRAEALFPVHRQEGTSHVVYERTVDGRKHVGVLPKGSGDLSRRTLSSFFQQMGLTEEEKIEFYRKA